MIIPGLFLKMPQWPWTLISWSCWVFAGVPVGNVTFKLTPSLELRGNHEDRTDRPAEDLTVRHRITPTLAPSRENLLSSTLSPWATCATQPCKRIHYKHCAAKKWQGRPKTADTQVWHISSCRKSPLPDGIVAIVLVLSSTRLLISVVLWKFKPSLVIQTQIKCPVT